MSAGVVIEMWFVWDGRTRAGPLSEQEICRRVSGGQIALNVYVRPEHVDVYRPLIWMLPSWTSARPRNEHEQTVIRAPLPMQDATQVAVLDDRFITPPAASQFIPSAPLDMSPASQLSSPSLPSPPASPSTLTVPAAKVTVPNPPPPDVPDEVQLMMAVNEVHEEAHLEKASFKLSGHPFNDDEQSDDIAARAVAEAIREGERQTREFENRSRTPESPEPLEIQAPSKLQVASKAKRKSGRDGVQSPALVSEGSVSLVDNNSATQIKFRRVNPTAPRRRNRNSALRFADKMSLAALSRGRKGDANLSLVLLTFLVLVVLGFVGLYIYEKKQTVNALKSSQSVSNIVEQPKPQRNQPRPPTVRRPKDRTKNKSLASKPTPPEIASNPKVFSNVAELKSYLQKRGAGGSGEFIVVGPITLQNRPAKKCQPCLGSGRLPDGTQINLSSVMSKPWRSVGNANVVYARGFLIGSSGLTLTVNAMSRSPF